jgi:hypothetical protein
MRDHNLPAATVMVGRFHSHCNACGQECDPSTETHDRILGYGPNNGDAGCGIAWQYVYSTYLGAGAEQATRSLRPDLEFIPIELPNAAK